MEVTKHGPIKLFYTVIRSDSSTTTDYISHLDSPVLHNNNNKMVRIYYINSTLYIYTCTCRFTLIRSLIPVVYTPDTRTRKKLN